MQEEKALLLKAAARLYSIGVEVEAARERLRALAADGTAYDSPEMTAALEQQYLQLRETLREDQGFLPAPAIHSQPHLWGRTHVSYPSRILRPRQLQI